MGLYRPGHVANASWASRKGKGFLCGGPGLLPVGAALLRGSALGSTLCKNGDGGSGASCGAGWKQREGNHLMFENRSEDQWGDSPMRVVSPLKLVQRRKKGR